jgi:hypothetical protein
MRVEVDREPRHVEHEEIDRRAALERQRVVVDEHERRDARQQPGAVEIDLVYDFSTGSPSSERDTHGRSLPLGNDASVSCRARVVSPH